MSKAKIIEHGEELVAALRQGRGADESLLVRASDFLKRHAGGRSPLFLNVAVQPILRSIGEKHIYAASVIDDYLKDLKRGFLDDEEPSPPAVRPPYVNPTRLDDLRAMKSTKFDLAKLIRQCEELNISFNSGCYFAVAMLTRSILDHVPPLFGKSKFAEVVSNYAGSKSFKETMDHLQKSSRKISDSFLHEQIRSSEVLPTSTQVDFSQSLDTLLAEIIRMGKAGAI